MFSYLIIYYLFNQVFLKFVDSREESFGLRKKESKLNLKCTEICERVLSQECLGVMSRSNVILTVGKGNLGENRVFKCYHSFYVRILNLSTS